MTDEAPTRGDLADDLIDLVRRLFWADIEESRLLDAIKLSEQLATKVEEYQSVARHDAFEMGLGRVRGDDNRPEPSAS
jgi:hypothetical protein